MLYQFTMLLLDVLTPTKRDGVTYHLLTYELIRQTQADEAAERDMQEARNNEGKGDSAGSHANAPPTPIPIEANPAISAKRDEMARSAGASTGEELAQIQKKPKLAGEDGINGTE